MNVASIAHVLVTRATLFFCAPFHVVNAHHKTTLPSNCCIILFIVPFENVPVNAASTDHVVVTRAILFLVTPLNVVNAHHTKTFPSNCSKNTFTQPLANVPVNV